jgi:glycosyltransferase involved in cell wall biosynthesis
MSILMRKSEPIIDLNHTQYLPKITVYIVTKNRLDQLKQAIKSVESQTLTDWELIVVDDGSTDETASFLRNRGHTPKFRWYHNDISVGAAAARNVAISQARGEFITGLDDDDRFRPERLQRFLENWEPGHPVLTSWDTLERVDGRGITWRKPRVITWQDLLYKNLIGNQVFTRTEYLQEIGGFDPALPSAQDYDTWIRLVKLHGPVRVVQESLQIIMMRPGDARISSGSRTWLGYFACYRKHKSDMNRAQRKYHLHTIRLAQGKQRLMDVFFWTPKRYWVKEVSKFLFKT